MSRKVEVELYIKTVAGPTNPTGALVCCYPLPYNSTSSSMTMNNADEQFGRSNVLVCPVTYDTMTRSTPLLKKTYAVWDAIGISESVYSNTPELHSCNYAGLLTSAGNQCVCVQVGTESAATDATLSVRLDYFLNFEIEFYARNNLIISAPHS